ncbi:hypothetical protein [Pedobacter sp. Leaf250]|uniref:glycosyl-4,4'-diaponeurosporenoate acyltransferase CrtO family protein n=1 Tax=Pedobacter sp. Leaf250 TaxID=2876559 RepID=UPI001E4120B5|nr:hypothetical protein [Pedobacter sp. Leaf250]
MIKQITFSLSITFLSWIIGMIINAFLIKTPFYKEKLTNLNFVKTKKLNKLMGIGVIKWIIKNTFFKFFNPKLRMKSKIDQNELRVLRYEMTLAEVNHLIAFAAVVIFALVMVFKEKYILALVMMIVNMLMNLYPSLLQQENKRRLNKLERIMNSKHFSDVTTEDERTEIVN